MNSFRPKSPPPENVQSRDGAQRISRIMTGVVGTMALVVVVFVGLSRFYGNKAREIGQSEDTTLRQIILGNDVINVPGNVIRFDKQRQAIALNRLDLYFLWPGFEGYSRKRDHAFFGPPRTTQDLIFVTLEKRKFALDMSARMGVVYARLLEGPQQPSVAGLVFQLLRPEAGYSGEELHYENHGPHPYVVRCQMLETDKHDATCMRDVHVGDNLSLTYRFSRKHLEQWRAIEAALTNIVRGYLAN